MHLYRFYKYDLKYINNFLELFTRTVKIYSWLPILMNTVMFQGFARRSCKEKHIFYSNLQCNISFARRERAQIFFFFPRTVSEELVSYASRILRLINLLHFHPHPSNSFTFSHSVRRMERNILQNCFSRRPVDTNLRSVQRVRRTNSNPVGKRPVQALFLSLSHYVYTHNNIVITCNLVQSGQLIRPSHSFRSNFRL